MDDNKILEQGKRLNWTHVYGSNCYCEFKKGNDNLNHEFSFFTFVNDQTDDSGIRARKDMERIVELEAKYQKSCRWWRDSFELMHQRAMRAEEQLIDSGYKLLGDSTQQKDDEL